MLVVPMIGVVRCLDLSGTGPAAAEGVVNFEGHAVPFARLRSVFGVPGRAPDREVVVVIRRGGESIGLAIDQIVRRSQIVVRPPGRFFRKLPAIAGLTILGDGRVAPILNVWGVLEAHARGPFAEVRTS
jgi:two-component system chemotaxis sensor kinase CheA